MSRRRWIKELLSIAVLAAPLVVCCSSCTEEELWGNPDDNTGGSDDDGGGPGEPDEPPEEGDTLLFGVEVTSDSLFTVSRFTGALNLIGPLDPDSNTYTAPTGMAVRSSDNSIFVWNNAEPAGVLLRVDPCTGLGTPVNETTPPQGELDAIAFQGDRLWGVGPREGTTQFALFEVITSTGLKNLIGGNLPRLGGLDSDASRILYGVERGFDDSPPPLSLFTINTTSAVETLVALLDESIRGVDSIAFDGDQLLASGEDRDGETILFDINPDTGEVSNVRPMEQIAQGLGIAPGCSSDFGARGASGRRGGAPPDETPGDAPGGVPRR